MSNLKHGLIIVATFCVGFVVGVLSSGFSTNGKVATQESIVTQEATAPTPVASPNITADPEKSPLTANKPVETKRSPIVQSNPSYATVFTFSGDGAKKSEPFSTTGSRFKIKYNCNGDFCQAMLYKTGSNLPSGLIMNKAGSTSDETIFYGAGTYYIDANTIGSYSMTVEDFK